MSAIVNYVMEANLSLIVVVAFYYLFLRNETNFSLLRMFMLIALLTALVLPLIQIRLDTSTQLSIGRVIPTFWLPEVNIRGDSTPAVKTFPVWNYISTVYVVGLCIVLGLVAFRLAQLLRLIQRSVTYRRRYLRIAECSEEKPTFSFFNFIFIGNAPTLSRQEKEQIILHESVHAARWHSFDVLLIHLVHILFWFNPLVSTYKKIFVQLHEFEADARAVENRDVDKYCSLLARVALQSANFTLANHFNNSLTIKRIEMMRTIKSDIRRWKVAASVAMLPLLFFFIACHDQIADDLTQITKNSTHALIVPEEITRRFEQLKKENPDKNYALLELNETASQKLRQLEAQYGLPKHIEVFNTSAGDPDTQRPGPGDLQLLSTTAESKYSEVSLTKTEAGMKGQTFAIVEFNDQASQVSDAAAQEDQIYTVVEQQPEYPGGFDPMLAFIRENMRYPADAREQGQQGTVYVSFIVEKDGSVTSTKVLRGVSPSVDQEAQRVVDMFPKWKPGKQNGQAVRVRFVLPIKFQI